MPATPDRRPASPHHHAAPFDPPTDISRDRLKLMHKLEQELAKDRSAKLLPPVAIALFVRHYVIYQAVERNESITSWRGAAATIGVSVHRLREFLKPTKDGGFGCSLSRTNTARLVAIEVIPPLAMAFVVRPDERRELISAYNRRYSEAPSSAEISLERMTGFVRVAAKRMGNHGLARLDLEQGVLAMLASRPPTKPIDDATRVQELVLALGKREHHAAAGLLQGAIVLYRQAFLERFLDRRREISSVVQLACAFGADPAELRQMIEINHRTNSTCSGFDYITSNQLVTVRDFPAAQIFWLTDPKAVGGFWRGLKEFSRAPTIDELCEPLLAVVARSDREDLVAQVRSYLEKLTPIQKKRSG